MTDGTAQCWGSNTNYALGDGGVVPGAPDWCSYACSMFPIPVQNHAATGALTSVANLTGNDSSHFCVLITDGTVQCWGRNGSSELGDSTTQDRCVPITVGVASPPDVVSAAPTEVSAVNGDRQATVYWKPPAFVPDDCRQPFDYVITASPGNVVIHPVTTVPALGFGRTQGLRLRRSQARYCVPVQRAGDERRGQQRGVGVVERRDTYRAHADRARCTCHGEGQPGTGRRRSRGVPPPPTASRSRVPRELDRTFGERLPRGRTCDARDALRPHERQGVRVHRECDQPDGQRSGVDAFEHHRRRHTGRAARAHGTRGNAARPSRGRHPRRTSRRSPGTTSRRTSEPSRNRRRTSRRARRRKCSRDCRTRRRTGSSSPPRAVSASDPVPRLRPL